MSQPILPINEWDPWWDQWIYGAKNIGATVNLTERQAYHALDQGLLEAERFGKRRWRSTRRRRLRPTAPAPLPDTTASPASQTQSAADSLAREGSRKPPSPSPAELSPQPQRAEQHATAESVA